MLRVRTDARSRRRPVATRHQLAAAYVLFVAILASNAPSPLYVVYQRQWHFSSLTVTAIFATYALAVLASLLVVGRLSDRIGRRRVLWPATVLMACSAALFLLAQGVVWLFAARAVQGVATGMLAGAVTAALVELDPHGDHRRGSLVNTVAFVVGAATGPLLVGLCAQYLPAPTVVPFGIELGLLALAVPGLRALPETVRLGGQRGRLLARPRVPAEIRRPFAIAGLVIAVSWSVGALYAALGPSIAAQLLHVRSHAAAGLLLFAFNMLGGASQLALRGWHPRRSMAAGAASLGAGIALVWTSLAVSSTPIFASGTVLVGLGGGMALMGSLSLVNQVAPPLQRAEIVSAFNMVGYLALALPVVAVGVLTGPLGLRAATGAFAAVVVVAAAGALLALRFHHEDPAPPGPPEPVLALDPAACASGLA